MSRDGDWVGGVGKILRNFRENSENILGDFLNITGYAHTGWSDN